MTFQQYFSNNNKVLGLNLCFPIEIDLKSLLIYLLKNTPFSSDFELMDISGVVEKAEFKHNTLDEVVNEYFILEILNKNSFEFYSKQNEVNMLFTVNKHFKGKFVSVNFTTSSIDEVTKIISDTIWFKKIHEEFEYYMAYLYNYDCSMLCSTVTPSALHSKGISASEFTSLIYQSYGMEMIDNENLFERQEITDKFWMMSSGIMYFSTLFLSVFGDLNIPNGAQSMNLGNLLRIQLFNNPLRSYLPDNWKMLNAFRIINNYDSYIQQVNL